MTGKVEKTQLLRMTIMGGGSKEVGCGQCVLYHVLNCHTAPLDIYINVDKK